MKRRVVVTGMGVLSSIGNTLAEFRENLKKESPGRKTETTPRSKATRSRPFFGSRNLMPVLMERIF